MSRRGPAKSDVYKHFICNEEGSHFICQVQNADGELCNRKISATT